MKALKQANTLATFNIKCKRALPRKQHTEFDAYTSFQKGEQAGFDHYFDQLYTSVHYFASNILEDESAAEDVVEDSFVKLWLHRERIQQPAAIKSYLYTAVRNACIDIKRREKVMRLYQSQVMHSPENVERPVVNRIIEAETLREVHQAIELLPPKMAQVFRMLLIEGKGHQEVAQALNITVEGVRSHKSKAIQLLKQRLTPLAIGLLLPFLL